MEAQARNRHRNLKGLEARVSPDRQRSKPVISHNGIIYSLTPTNMTQPRNNAGLFLCDDRGGTINVMKTNAKHSETTGHNAKNHIPQDASLARRAAQLEK